ncbi:MAG: D-alanine--D-alanine ligase [Sedimentisphaerales bacterium]|nr:D-alanine--D-alanine ligase [Sedimentisphaerales bacterium]
MPVNPESPTPESPTRVAVLMGGIGTERDISIESGKAVADALAAAGFDVVTADIDPDRLEILEDKSIDVFFPVLHGKFGEDGTLQRILEQKELLYAGSGPDAGRTAFDKIAAKQAFARANVLTPAAIKFEPGDDPRTVEARLRNLGETYVVKPITQGSSVGVSIVSSPQSAVETARKTASDFGDCMIEQFIPGRELTVGILCGRPLPIIEIRTAAAFYDYHAKYIDEQTGFLFDTIAEPRITAEIRTAAVNAFDTLDCRDFARVDFILSEDNKPYALEVNTIPGFTSHSLLPKAAAKIGIEMPDLCRKIVESAISNRSTSNAARPPCRRS